MVKYEEVKRAMNRYFMEKLAIGFIVLFFCSLFAIYVNILSVGINTDSISMLCGGAVGLTFSGCFLFWVLAIVDC
jgi:hypothetical protein